MILQDASAAEWFARRGLVGEAPEIVVVDEFGQDGLVLTRVWHSPAGGRLEAPLGVIVLVLQLDGALELGGAEALRIEPGGSFVLAGGQQVAAALPEAGARLELMLPATGELAALPADRLPAMLWPRDEATWSRAALVSLSNIVLNLGVRSQLSEFDRFSTALHAAATAFLRSARDPPVREPWAPALTRRAALIIARAAGDPRFSVTALAQELRVTPSHLSRAFREAGRPSPRQVIREHRRQLALALLARDGDGPGRPDTERLARLSGFGSSDSLRRALRER